jgi:hypothetical protein
VVDVYLSLAVFQHPLQAKDWGVIHSLTLDSHKYGDEHAQPCSTHFLSVRANNCSASQMVGIMKYPVSHRVGFSLAQHVLYQNCEDVHAWDGSLGCLTDLQDRKRAGL